MNNFVMHVSAPRHETRRSNLHRTDSSERGVALLAAILLALILSALGAALTVSGQTETSIVRNHQRAAEARSSAEAGLSHAVQMAVRNLDAFQANGFATPNAAISRLLRGPDNAVHANAANAANADNGSLEALELAGETELPRFPTVLAMPGMIGASYQARIIDEDHPSRNLTAADRVRIGENGQTWVDANTRAVIQVTGFALDNTQVTLEVMLGNNGGPAIVTDQSLTINGNPTINGGSGGVHSNVDLTVTGSPVIAQGATATGTYTETGNPTVGGEKGGGRPVIPIAAVQASNYRVNADFVLTTGPGGGKIHGPFTNIVTGTLGPQLCNASGNNANCEATYGWVYDPGNNGWKVSSNFMADGTFYVQGNVTISGNPGNSGPPKIVTIIAEGNIEVSGTPRFQPDTQGLMFVTDRDLKLNGNYEMIAGSEADILVREQLSISGNPIIYGRIWVDNASNLSNLVTNTEISGNPTITYNGTLTGGGFTVAGWREMR